ncbi:MAG: O-antigen ligase family protein, partial [Planctomycetota bacterium]
MSNAESSVRRTRQREMDTGAAVDRQQIFVVGMAGLAAALIFSRFFLPAESAAQGDTLWIVTAWMIFGTIASLGISFRWLPSLRMGPMDFAVFLWMGGQIVASIVVVVNGGDKRSATNLAWEWVGLFVVWMVVRHGMVDRSIRQAILRALIVTGALLAGFGLYQHYVSHPQMVAEYSPLFDKLHTANGSELVAVKQRLTRDGIPTEGSAAILFEKRLRDSREPLALFALANTFGGFLAVTLVLLLGEVLATWQRGGRWKVILSLVVIAGVIGWCLLLTKSRTACIGTLCGVLVLLAPWVRLSGRLRRFLLPIGFAMVAATGVVGLLLAIGSLDHQVLSEAPKSLSYRIQYWRATSRMIAAHPWIGVGPGNFRQSYLQYKLPEASEEIADPHNMFFEMAATGGVFSLAGLLVLLGLGLMRGRVNPQSPTEGDRTVGSAPDYSTVVFWLAGAGPVLAFFGQLLWWGEWEDRLFILSLVWSTLGGLLAVCWPRPAKLSAAVNFEQSDIVRAAAVVLVVHLMGAGGISMPAMTQILLLLLAWGGCRVGTEPTTTTTTTASVAR